MAFLKWPSALLSDLSDRIDECVLAILHLLREFSLANFTSSFKCWIMLQNPSLALRKELPLREAVAQLYTAVDSSKLRSYLKRLGH